jgi:signal peptidase I
VKYVRISLWVLVARHRAVVAVLAMLVLAILFSTFTHRVTTHPMMPTLLAGDVVVVNTLAYELRMPVINRNILRTGSPRRGDVVLFRYPRDRSLSHISRVVGLPGDHVEVHNDRLTINGLPVSFKIVGEYTEGCYLHFQRATERIGTQDHDVLLCPVPLELPATVSPSCREPYGYLCDPTHPPAISGLEQRDSDQVVPAGSYLTIGDNRDNSDDGRFWGFVPDANLVGEVTLILFNWDWQRSGSSISRIGKKVE